ncbi:hypothetical protein Pla52o_24850 [Novipirellula galeiformis]|uniref:Knr4/Smi1-like domain-containing protein n=1 Tax=Novipirellula galeiformis TaxID=2528004 RepID=A0A5C6CFN1_9BACT|nr:hypothetical protein [Novipirellula galeiformis]TWU22952.1 hypothetical protein Pla52o_24850 [Novipirellula galeiformis]
MNDWREWLRSLVSMGDCDTFPLLVFHANPPANEPWPSDLPASPAIRDLFAICDGGFFGDFNWFGLSPQLPERERLTLQNAYWHEQLSGYYPDGTSPLTSGQHLILGNDASGSPLIWDQINDRVSTFYFKGGDWEPIESSFEEFMVGLFFPETVEENDFWHEALSQLKEQAK